MVNKLKTWRKSTLINMKLMKATAEMKVSNFILTPWLLEAEEEAHRLAGPGVVTKGLGASKSTITLLKSIATTMPDTLGLAIRPGIIVASPT